MTTCAPTRRSPLVALACAGGVLLAAAGCGDDGRSGAGDGGQTVVVTSTTTPGVPVAESPAAGTPTSPEPGTAASEAPAPGIPAPASSGERTPATPPGSAEHPCDARVAVQEAIASLPRFADRGWVLTGSNLLCAPLGYATATVESAIGSSPTQVLLFHEGRYLGTATRCNLIGQVTGSTDSSVTVTYRWRNPGESNAEISGRAPVTFRWNGTRVVMEDPLPEAAKLGQSC